MSNRPIFIALIIILWILPAKADDVTLDSTYVAAVSPDELPHASAKQAAKQFNTLRSSNEARLSAQVIRLIQNFKRQTLSLRLSASRQGDLAATSAADQKIAQIDESIEAWRSGVPPHETSYRLTVSPHNFPTIEPSCRILKDGLDTAYRDYFLREQQAISDFAERLSQISKLLIRNNDLESASLLETKVSRLQSESRKLANAINEGGWRVVFLSNDPSIWNSDTQKGSDSYAVAFGSNRSFDGYIRIVRTDNGHSKILRLRTDDITKITHVGQYIWNGTAAPESKRRPEGNIAENRLLGIADKSLELNYRSPYNAVVNLPGRGNGYGGWGFARRSLLYSGQTCAWGKDQVENDIAFEISLKTHPLSTRESESLLNPDSDSPQLNKLPLATTTQTPALKPVAKPQVKPEEASSTSPVNEESPQYTYRYSLRLIDTGGGTSRFTIYSSDGSVSNGSITSPKYDRNHIDFHGFFRNDSNKTQRFQLEIRIAKKTVRSMGFRGNEPPVIIGRAIHKTQYLKPGEIEEFNKIIAVPDSSKVGTAAIGNVEAFE